MVLPTGNNLGISGTGYRHKQSTFGGFAATKFGYAASPAYYNGVSPAQGGRTRIMYFGDFHEARHQIAKAETAINDRSQEGRRLGADVFVLSGGDTNTGNEAHELELNMRLNDELMDDPNIFVGQVPGNHDFDAGEKALASSIANAEVPLTAANLRIGQNSPLQLALKEQTLSQGARVFTNARGERYGLIGVTVPSAKKFMNVEAQNDGVHFFTLDETIAKVQAQADQLAAYGVNRVILDTHIGFEDAQAIARRTRGIDIIISAHDHKERRGIIPGSNYLRSASGDPVTIVNAGGYGEFTGMLDGWWDAWGRFSPLQNELIPLKPFKKATYVTEMVDQHLGTPRLLGRMKDEFSTRNARTGGENAVANRVVDIFTGVVGAEIGLFRGTELRSNISKGTFTDRDLKNLLPFNDPLVKLKMTGATIVQALEESARCLQLGKAHPGILHAANLRYVVDKPTGKVVEVLVWDRSDREWEPIDPKRHYTVATGNYALKNKGEFQMLKRSTIVKPYEFTLRDAFGKFIESQNNRPLDFKLDGRLKVINDPPPAKTTDFQAYSPQPVSYAPAIPAYNPWASYTQAF